MALSQKNKATFRRIVRSTAGGRPEITPGTYLRKDLGLDDLDIVEIIMETEKTFNISLPDSSLEKRPTISSFYELINKKLRGKRK